MSSKIYWDLPPKEAYLMSEKGHDVRTKCYKCKGEMKYYGGFLDPCETCCPHVKWNKPEDIKAFFDEGRHYTSKELDDHHCKLFNTQNTLTIDPNIRQRWNELLPSSIKK